MSYEYILFSTDAGIARLTLNRPDRLNSFNDAMHAEVRDALAHVEADTSVRVLLLTGAGRGFCAGQDLGDRAVAPATRQWISARRSSATTSRWCWACARCRCRSSARSTASRRAPGANLALACDLVIAAKSASFIQAFCKIGLIPDSGGTYFLPRLVGQARALGLSLLGDKLTAEQAAQWGLIWQCVDDAELPAVTDKLLAHLAQAPTRGLAAIKEALQASAGNTLAGAARCRARLAARARQRRRLSRRRGRVRREAAAALHRPLMPP